MRFRLAGALALSWLGAACVGEIGRDGKPDDAFLFGTGGAGGEAGSGGAELGGGPEGGSGAAGGEGGVGGEAPPPLAHLVEIPLGVMKSGDEGVVEVPETALSLTLVGRTAGAFDRFGFREVFEPGGEPLVSDYALPGGSWEFAWYGASAVAVPLSDHPSAMPLAPGAWRFVVGGPEDASLGGRVTAYLRQTEDGEFHGGLVDVNAFISPGAGSEDYLLGVLADACEGFAGLGIGDVTVHPLPAERDVIDSAVDFLRVLEETAVASARPALNVLFVADLAGELEGAVGIAASIPGQGVVHGTHLSGVVAEVTGDPAVDVHVLRHETGHLSGLFHTSEIDLPHHDPLGDTPECGSVKTEGLSCPDADNLMFPYVVEKMGLSPKQARVLRGSTLYRGVVSPGGEPAPPGVEPGPASGARRFSGQEALARRTRGASFAPPSFLPEGAYAWLRGAHCPLAPFDAEAFSRAYPGLASEALALLAEAPAAPPHVRERALEVFGERLRKMPKGPRRAAGIRRLEAVILDRGARIRLRLGALRGLGRSAPGRVASLEGRLDRAPRALVLALGRALRP